MNRPTRPTEELVQIYDKSFETKAAKRSSWPGDAHKAGLSSVYNTGVDDGIAHARG